MRPSRLVIAQRRQRLILPNIHLFRLCVQQPQTPYLSRIGRIISRRSHLASPELVLKGEDLGCFFLVVEASATRFVRLRGFGEGCWVRRTRSNLLKPADTSSCPSHLPRWCSRRSRRALLARKESIGMALGEAVSSCICWVYLGMDTSGQPVA